MLQLYKIIGISACILSVVFFIFSAGMAAAGVGNSGGTEKLPLLTLAVFAIPAIISISLYMIIRKGIEKPEEELELSENEEDENKETS